MSEKHHTGTVVQGSPDRKALHASPLGVSGLKTMLVGSATPKVKVRTNHSPIKVNTSMSVNRTDTRPDSRGDSSTDISQAQKFRPKLAQLKESLQMMAPKPRKYTAKEAAFHDRTQLQVSTFNFNGTGFASSTNSSMRLESDFQFVTPPTRKKFGSKQFEQIKSSFSQHTTMDDVLGTRSNKTGTISTTQPKFLPGERDNSLYAIDGPFVLEDEDELSHSKRDAQQKVETQMSPTKESYRMKPQRKYVTEHSQARTPKVLSYSLDIHQNELKDHGIIPRLPAPKKTDPKYPQSAGQKRNSISTPKGSLVIDQKLPINSMGATLTVNSRDKIPKLDVDQVGKHIHTSEAEKEKDSLLRIRKKVERIWSPGPQQLRTQQFTQEPEADLLKIEYIKKELDLPPTKMRYYFAKSLKTEAAVPTYSSYSNSPKKKVSTVDEEALCSMHIHSYNGYSDTWIKDWLDAQKHHKNQLSFMETFYAERPGTRGDVRSRESANLSQQKQEPQYRYFSTRQAFIPRTRLKVK